MVIQSDAILDTHNLAKNCLILHISEDVESIGCTILLILNTQSSVWILSRSACVVFCGYYHAVSRNLVHANPLVNHSLNVYYCGLLSLQIFQETWVVRNCLSVFYIRQFKT